MGGIIEDHRIVRRVERTADGGQYIETEITERIWHDTAPRSGYSEGLAPMEFGPMEYDFTVGQELICYWADPAVAPRFIMQVGKMKWHIQAGRPNRITGIEAV